MQEKSRSRNRGKTNRRASITYLVNFDGHNIQLTREQVIANGQGWKKCHGIHGETKVNSLSIKRMGGTIFLKSDKGRLSAFDANELAVALPEAASLIKDATGTAVSMGPAAG